MMFDEVKAEDVKSKMATIRIAKRRWVPLPTGPILPLCPAVEGVFLERFSGLCTMRQKGDGRLSIPPTSAFCLLGHLAVWGSKSLWSGNKPCS